MRILSAHKQCNPTVSLFSKVCPCIRVLHAVITGGTWRDNTYPGAAYLPACKQFNSVFDLAPKYAHAFVCCML
jgi:hypothetical protein